MSFKEHLKEADIFNGLIAQLLGLPFILAVIYVVFYDLNLVIFVFLFQVFLWLALIVYEYRRFLKEHKGA